MLQRSFTRFYRGIYFLGLALPAAGLAAGNSTPISGIHFYKSPKLSGMLTLAGQTYELKQGDDTVSLSFSPVSADQVSILLKYSESQNKGADQPALTATITSKINSAGGASGGTVSIDRNTGDLPDLVANCDGLFTVSRSGSASGRPQTLDIRFNGFETLSSCTPAGKADLALYNPRMIGKRDPSQGLTQEPDANDLQRGLGFTERFELDNKFYLRDGSDPVVRYVQSVAEKIVAASDRPDLKVSVFVLDIDKPNAFSIPGGFLFMNIGLLRALNSEAELAAVLGHEWAHVTCRHDSRRRFAVEATDEKASADAREYEYEADAVGTQYAWNAGYEPWALTRVLELFEMENPKDGDSKSENLSNHPSSYKRADRVNFYSMLFFPGKLAYVHSTEEFRQMKDALNSIRTAEQTPLLIHVYGRDY